MISYRYALTSIAMAVCQLASAQTSTFGGTPATNVITESAGGPSAVGTGTAAAAPAPLPAASAAAEERTSQPRILRGDDRVIAAPAAVPPITGPAMTFSFEEAPVAEVVRTVLGDIAKANYVLHPPLNGTVTLSTRNPIPPDQAMFLLESALQANGLSMIRDARGTYHVGRPDALRAIGGTLRQFRSGEPLPPGNGAVILPLQYIGASEMAAILRPMVTPDAIVRVDNLRNLLVMSGTRTQAEAWMDLVNTFDVDLLKGMSVGVFPLKYASVKEVEAALRIVSGGGGAAAPGAQAGVPPGAAAAATAAAGANQANAAPAMLGEGNPLFGALRIMPIDRINSILVVTPRAAYLEEARRWIEKLDQPSDNGSEPQLFIYHVQNGNAKHLAGVLSGIFGGQSSGGAVANSGVAPGLGGVSSNSFGQGNAFGGGSFGSSGFGSSGFGSSGFGSSGFGSGSGFGNSFGSSGGFGSRGGFGSSTQGNRGTQGQGTTSASIGTIRVMADELNNSVLIWGTKSEYSKIEATLKRLDLPPTQVLIEASIVEVTLDDTLQYGLQWAFNNSGPSGLNGAGQLRSSGSNVNTPIGSSIPTPVSAGFSYALSNSLGSVRVVLNALATKRLLKVISSPSLMVLDNHTAMMSVGNQQPVETATATNSNNPDFTTKTIQYRDTGVSLAVTPSVNAGNLVTMQIDQAVTDAVADSSGNVSLQPVFQQRQITSKVAVRSGEAIVLGGLIRDTDNTSKSGIPLLQELPLVGNLFSTNGKTGGRTELLVVITPKVVRTDIDIREVSDELRDRLKGLQVIELKQSGRSTVVPPGPGVTIQPLPPQ